MSQVYVSLYVGYRALQGSLATTDQAIICRVCIRTFGARSFNWKLSVRLHISREHCIVPVVVWSRCITFLVSGQSHGCAPDQVLVQHFHALMQHSARSKLLFYTGLNVSPDFWLLRRLGVVPMLRVCKQDSTCEYACVHHA